jgi:DNA-binding transcriptional LysR family regulator
MDAADLKFFEQVAQSGGMSRAAEKLNTVQSNVTRRIRALESELNVSLFNRTGRGVSLTPAGERLLPFAIRVARLIDEAASTIGDDGHPKGSLVIGSLETTAALRLTPILSQFVADFPEVDLSLKTGTSRELVEDVLEHRVEGAFVCGPVHHPDLLQRKMYQERLVVMTSRRERSLNAYLRKNDLRMVVCAPAAPIG